MMGTEWGDSSQFVSIGRAARFCMPSIVLGCFLAFTITFTLAILLGSAINGVNSDKWLNVGSGCIFIGFSVRGLFELTAII
jgi:putative Ca2+/H+ antiporter (TMEM165/GDT1 family)